MIFWIDAQLSPHLAPWLERSFEVRAHSVRKLGLRDAKDRQIFEAARDAGVVVCTRDKDFVRLLETMGPPPQVVWITCGNTSNEFLKRLLTATFPEALELLRKGEPLVEIGEAYPD